MTILTSIKQYLSGLVHVSCNNFTVVRTAHDRIISDLGIEEAPVADSKNSEGIISNISGMRTH